ERRQVLRGGNRRTERDQSSSRHHPVKCSQKSSDPSIFMAPQQNASPKKVDDYLARVTPRFRTALQQLRRTIKAAAPGAEEIISYKMPAFRNNGVLVYYGAFKDHCSFFVASAKVRREFSAELEPFETGKGTLRFTPDRPLPSGLVTRIVKARVAENASRRQAK